MRLAVAARAVQDFVEVPALQPLASVDPQPAQCLQGIDDCGGRARSDGLPCPLAGVVQQNLAQLRL
ncbi:hypothetical protein ACFWUW_27650 [Streptomyces sp. NPDC058655]|uniref:hypothetical protein n=1 Tax=Streptomyces sp. NPDC058655 TaxID=3346577 RepID=UPI003668149A